MNFLECRFLQSLLEQFTVSLCVSSSRSTPLLLAIGRPSSLPDLNNTGLNNAGGEVGEPARLVVLETFS
jgi:hypothetical protein